MSYRTMARNVFARDAECTRGEADLVLRNVSDEVCETLATATPEEAKTLVGEVMRRSAEKVLAAYKKTPATVAGGLNPMGESHEERKSDSGSGDASGLRTGGESPSHEDFFEDNQGADGRE